MLCFCPYRAYFVCVFSQGAALGLKLLGLQPVLSHRQYSVIQSVLSHRQYSVIRSVLSYRQFSTIWQFCRIVRFKPV